MDWPLCCGYWIEVIVDVVDCLPCLFYRSLLLDSFFSWVTWFFLVFPFSIMKVEFFTQEMHGWKKFGAWAGLGSTAILLSVGNPGGTESDRFTWYETEIARYVDYPASNVILIHSEDVWGSSWNSLFAPNVNAACCHAGRYAIFLMKVCAG